MIEEAESSAGLAGVHSRGHQLRSSSSIAMLHMCISAPDTDRISTMDRVRDLGCLRCCLSGLRHARKRLSAGRLIG